MRIGIGPHDGRGFCRPSLCQRSRRRRRVQGASRGEHPFPFGFRKIFVQHQQVIPERQIGFANAASLQRAAPDMIDFAGGLYADPVPGSLESPAQVYLFHMHAEALVQQPHLVQGGSAEQEGRPRPPENIPGFVVLSSVLFQPEKNAPAGKGVSQPIHEPARRAGVFEPGAVLVLQYLGLRGGYVVVGFHFVHERVEPVGRHGDVVIQQQRVFSRSMRNSLVIAPAKQGVFRIAHDPYGGETLPDPFGGTIVRSIVGQHDFQIFVSGGRNGRETLLQERQCVPGNDDNGYPRAYFGHADWALLRAVVFCCESGGADRKYPYPTS